MEKIEEKIKVPDRYGFWRCDGKNKEQNKKIELWGWYTVQGMSDCPYRDKCWRTKDIETQWYTYSRVCGEWNNYHWFWGDVLNRER